jgi:integrase
LVTDARDKAIFLVGTFCAMRTSEVFGLSWKSFHHEPNGESYFMVEQVAYDGAVHEETTKNEASRARVHIGPQTLKAVLQLQKETKDTSPDALLFQSTNKNGRSKKGSPMCAGIWLQRKVQPLADAIGVGFKVNFRATRRTACTLVQEHGGTVATAQSFLRHASPDATDQDLLSAGSGERENRRQRLRSSRLRRKENAQTDAGQITPRQVKIKGHPRVAFPVSNPYCSQLLPSCHRGWP